MIHTESLFIPLLKQEELIDLGYNQNFTNQEKSELSLQLIISDSTKLFPTKTETERIPWIFAIEWLLNEVNKNSNIEYRLELSWYELYKYSQGDSMTLATGKQHCLNELIKILESKMS